MHMFMMGDCFLGVFQYSWEERADRTMCMQAPLGSWAMCTQCRPHGAMCMKPQCAMGLCVQASCLCVHRSIWCYMLIQGSEFRLRFGSRSRFGDQGLGGLHRLQQVGCCADSACVSSIWRGQEGVSWVVMLEANCKGVRLVLLRVSNLT